MNKALEGDLHRLSKLLLKFKADAVDTSGFSSLHYASRAGNLEIVKFLVDHGANVNLLTRSNRSSPLHRASQQGHRAVVEYLLQSGADSGMQDADGCTPLHRAALANHSEICLLLVNHNPHLVQILDSRSRLPQDCCSSSTLRKLLNCSSVLKD